MRPKTSLVATVQLGRIGVTPITIGICRGWIERDGHGSGYAGTSPISRPCHTKRSMKPFHPIRPLHY